MLILGIVVLLIAAVALYLLPSDQPTYQGKTVQVWFGEYVNAAQSSGVTWSYSSRGRTLYDPQTGKQLSDPTGDAFRALDSNAVPYLISVIRVSPLESPACVRVFTNLPLIIRQRIPDPRMRNWYREKALEILSGLGESARPALPVMLKLLTHPDLFVRMGAVLAFSRSDRTLVETAVLELGSRQYYAEALALAERRKCQDVRVTQLLGKILESPDPVVQRRVIILLEEKGALAVPVAMKILGAMQSADREVRYYAARSLEAISGDASPEMRAQIIATMRSSLTDQHEIVRNVARRTLSKLAPRNDLTPSSN